jgi:hypothetical protein
MTPHQVHTDLAEGLLQLCRLATSQGRADVAEHLLCALEALASREPTAGRSLATVYLSLYRRIRSSSRSSRQ